MEGDYEIQELSGSALEPWLDALGELRIRVFREYPYLYDGSLEYERDYLQRYLVTEDALVVMVNDRDGNAVGATTCLPMVEEGSEFQQPFIETGLDINDICYFGESVLLAEWRGKGIGKRFFDLREAHARKLGLSTTTFCAVDRLDDDTRRPRDYRPLDGFWESRGYQKCPSLVARFPWKEIGEITESEKSLTFWLKRG